MSRLACALVVALALAVSGCVSAQAKGEPGGPSLAPPDPPPHTVIPVEIVESTPAPSAPPGPVAVIAPRPSRPPASKPEKAAEKPVEKPPDAVAAPAQPSTPPPAPLQTTPNVNEMETKIRKRMNDARFNLDRTGRGTLNDEQKAQYDSARRFLKQAEDALKVKNLVFAEELADKAATLAAALAPK